MISILTPSAEPCGENRNRVLFVLSWIFATCGALALAYAGFVIGDAIAFQKKATRTFEASKTEHSQYPASLSKASLTIGDVIGEIEAPELGLKAIVVEGDSARILRRAVGHLPNTAGPGEPGNVVLAGHRDSFFLPLRRIREGELVTFNLPTGRIRYQVHSIQTVASKQVEVLQPSSPRELTLITCFPFSYVGPAPKRLVVRARQVEPAP